MNSREKGAVGERELAGELNRVGMLARRTVRAVAKGRRHVRVPRRLSAMFWLGEAPRRLTEVVLARVPLDRG